MKVDLVLYANYKFCEEKNHIHFKNIFIYRSNQVRRCKKIKKNLYILEDAGNGVQVGDIEQVSKCFLKYDKNKII